MKNGAARIQWKNINISAKTVDLQSLKDRGMIMPEGIIRNLYYKIIKDISDFKKATDNEPNKILMTESAFEQLRDEGSISTGILTDKYYFEGIEVKTTDNINKTWIIV